MTTLQALADRKYLTLDMLWQSNLAAQARALYDQGITHARAIIYHMIHDLDQPPVCTCGAVLSWHDDRNQYRTYCSRKCSTQGTLSARQAQSLEQHGVAWPSQRPDFADKVAQTSQHKYGVAHYSQTQEFRSIQQRRHQQRRGSEKSRPIKHARRIPCTIINDPGDLEQRILDHFGNQGMRVQLHHGQIVFVDHALALEVQDLHAHTDEFYPDRYVHVNKLTQAQQQGITLWQFTDHEVLTAWPLIVSKISHALGLSQCRAARKLTIRYLSHREKQQFFRDNHLQGDVASSVNLALCDHDQPVMATAWGASRFQRRAHWELLRMSTWCGHHVQGGASRLFEYFVKHHVHAGQTLISYSHRRLSQGMVYGHLGMQFSHHTPPGYIYVRQGQPAGSRGQWQKHTLADKLEHYDPALTEHANMRAHGYYRYWDCGQSVFTFQQS